MKKYGIAVFVVMLLISVGIVSSQSYELAYVNGDSVIDKQDVELVEQGSIFLLPHFFEENFEVETETKPGELKSEVSNDVKQQTEKVEVEETKEVEEEKEKEMAKKVEFSQALWLAIPKIDLSTEVIVGKGWNSESQKNVPQLFFGDTPEVDYGGFMANTVIAGYSDIFGNIEALEIGDIIYLEFLGKRYIFEVDSISPNSHREEVGHFFPRQETIVTLMHFDSPESEYRYYVSAKIKTIEE